MSAVRESATDRAFRILRDRIINGEMQPGSHHSVYKLADELQLSRTPVREAVLRLADTRMVTIEKNRGVWVRGVTVDDIRDVFELRLLLEVPAAAHAARSDSPNLIVDLLEEVDEMRAAIDEDDDDRFREHDLRLHTIIAETFHNDALSRTLAGLRAETRRRGAWTANRSRRLIDIHAEHSVIVDGLLAGDPAVTSQAMWDHLVSTGTLLMQQVAAVSGETFDPHWAERLRPLRD